MFLTAAGGAADELFPARGGLARQVALLGCIPYVRRLPASRFREGRLLEPQGGHRPGKCGRQLMAIHIVM